MRGATWRSAWVWPVPAVVAVGAAGQFVDRGLALAVAAGAFLLALGAVVGAAVAARRQVPGPSSGTSELRSALADPLPVRPPELDSIPPGARVTSLQGANLRNAILSGQDLRFVDLRGAILDGANLEGADLRFADFRPLRHEHDES
jgi:hypothetical protein